MEIFLSAAYAMLFFYIIRKSKFYYAGILPSWLPAVFFLLKCISGIALGLIYTQYYTNHTDTDTFKFFTDSQIMFDTIYSRPGDFFRMITGIDGNAKELYPYYVKMNSWLNTNPFFNDNRTIIRMNAFFRFFSLGYYNVHVIFINFISFTGLFCLYKTFIRYCAGKNLELLIFTFLMPSVLFWGSGLLKDGILITGFGLLLYSFMRVMKDGMTAKRFAGVLAGLFILMVTKVYVLVLLLPGIFAWWLTRKMHGRKIILIFTSAYLMYFIIAFNIYHFNPEMNAAALIFYKQKNFLDLGNIHNATMIPMPMYECSAPAIVKSVPYAFANTMFRPFMTDVHGNPMILLSAIENAGLVLMIVICLLTLSLRKPIEPFVLLNLFFVFLLFALIGLITPVLGAIVRYKIVALPGLAFVLVYYYDRKKLLRWFSFLKVKKLRN